MRNAGSKYITIGSQANDINPIPRNEVRFEMARIIFVESAADNLLHLAVVQIDAWAEERFATCVQVLRHGVRVMEVDSKKEQG